MNFFDDYTQNDEDLVLGGFNVDFEDIDNPKKWDLVTDRKAPHIKRAVRSRRILAGPKLLQQVFVPVIKRDDDGNLKAGYTSFRRDPRSRGKHQLLDRLFIAEKKSNPGQKQYQFKYDQTWVYLVFCREDEEPMVRVAFYGNQIKKDIAEKQHASSPKDSSKLLHGPAVLYDIFITKTVDARVKGLGATSYSVEVDPDNKFSHKVPVSFWQTGFKPEFDFIKYGVFTEAEMEVITKFVQENGGSTLTSYLAEFVKPHSDEDIIAYLTENPINTFALRQGNPIFPDPDTFIKAVSELSLPLIKDKSEVPEAETEETDENVPDWVTEPQPGEVTEEKPDNPFKEPEEAEVVDETEESKPEDKDIDEPW